MKIPTLILAVLVLFCPSCKLVEGGSEGRHTTEIRTLYDQAGKVTERLVKQDTEYSQSNLNGKRSIKNNLDLDKDSPTYGLIKSIDITSETDASPAVQTNAAQISAAREITKDAVSGFRDTLQLAKELYNREPSAPAGKTTEDIAEMKTAMKSLAAAIAELVANIKKQPQPEDSPTGK